MKGKHRVLARNMCTATLIAAAILFASVSLAIFYFEATRRALPFIINHTTLLPEPSQCPRPEQGPRHPIHGQRRQVIPWPLGLARAQKHATYRLSKQVRPDTRLGKTLCPCRRPIC